MLELTTEPVEGEEPANEIALFSLDGKVYSIPDRARPGVSWRYMSIIRHQGLATAETWLAEEMLGAEAYNAITGYPNLTVEIMSEILTIARGVVFGEVVPKGKTSGVTRQRAPKKANPTGKTTAGPRARKTP